VPEGPLFLLEFPLIVPDLGVIALQRLLSFPRLLPLMPVGVPIPGPARVVHLLALFLQLIRVAAAGGAPLFYLSTLALDILLIPPYLPLVILGLVIIRAVIVIAIASVRVGSTAPGER